jgi:hypothetical protein
VRGAAALPADPETAKPIATAAIPAATAALIFKNTLGFFFFFFCLFCFAYLPRSIPRQGL